MASSILTLCACSLILLLKNQYHEAQTSVISLKNTTANFGKVMKTSWVAFLFPMMYGVLEACLNSNFPVFAMKNGVDVNLIILIIPAFSLGAIMFQVPLGMISDKVNRNLLLSTVTFIGACIFILCQFFISNGYVLLALFFSQASLSDRFIH